MPLAIREFELRDFTLRDFQPSDFDTLWQIDQHCFAPGISYSRVELRSYLRRAGAFTLVAVSPALHPERPTAPNRLRRLDNQTGQDFADGILGFIVTEVEHGKGHIITIDVVAAARRHGVGSLLITGAEHRLRAAHYPLIELETAVDNISALAFYKRHGYVVAGTIPRYYSNGVDALLVRKALVDSRIRGWSKDR